MRSPAKGKVPQDAVAVGELGMKHPGLKMLSHSVFNIKHSKFNII